MHTTPTPNRASGSPDPHLAPVPRRAAPRRRMRRGLPAGLFACALVLAGCGGSDDDTSDTGSDGSTTSAAASEAPASDGGDDDAAAPADLDVCAEITADEVSDILGVAITHAEPNTVWTSPNCMYGIDMDGFPDGATVAAIQWFEPPYFEGQKDLQTDAEPVPELQDGILLTSGSPMVVLRGTSGDFQVQGGVELSVGGETASAEQLVELAVLAQEL